MIKKVCSLLLVLLVSGAAVLTGLAAAAIQRYQNHVVVPPDELPPSLEEQEDSCFNVLLLGVDKGNTRTDTIILAHVDRDRREVHLVSLPRDTRVHTVHGYHRLNSCTVKGGLELLLQTVGEISGVPIHYYVQINTEGFRKCIDLLDGVWFDVPQRMKYSDPYQDLYIDLQPGYQLLDGDKAEQLVRFRRYPAADIRRGEVQRDFLAALLEQKLKPDYIKKAPALFDEILQHVRTNASIGDLMRNIGLLPVLSSCTVSSYTLKGEGQTIGGAAYFVPDEAYAAEVFQHFAVEAAADTAAKN